MFKEHTLFIVGAGASKEVGMPDGRMLSKTISRNSLFEFDRGAGLVDGDHNILDHLNRKYPSSEDLNPRLKALRHISEGIYLAGSIDNFIDIHSSSDPLIGEMGKFAIAVAMMDAEANSHLAVDSGNIYNRLDLEKGGIGDTWLDSFARILLEKTRLEHIEDIGRNNSIICFNYDRCIEFYLANAISALYRIEYERAHSLVANMNIVHPYGTLGKLPKTLQGNRGHGFVPFGTSIKEYQDPWPIAEQIKTYTEQVEEEYLIESIHEAVGKASQVVFLGFAFHPQNMELLSSGSRGLMTQTGGLGNRSVFATGMGISTQQVEEIKRRIASIFVASDMNDAEWDRNIHLEVGASCADLFNMHWRNLSES